MSIWVYSHEPLPAEHLMRKPGYTPEIPMYAGINLIIKGKEWQKLPDYFPMVNHRDWTDKRGTHSRVYSDDIIKGLKHLAERGVIFLDHEPTATEKAELPKVSEELNIKFRAEMIRLYEEQIEERKVTGKGRSRPTPYENECYDMLGMEKPYSPEALRAQRNPGAEAADRIADAISGALKRDREELLAKSVSKPQPEAAKK